MLRPVALCSATHFFAEIKRSCNPRFEEGEIRQFVSFYWTLFSAPKKTLRLNATVPAPILEAIADQKTVLLFVFNGSDSESVFTTLKRVIQEVTGAKNGKIFGHRVFTVWCSSADMIKWAEILEIESALKEKDAALKEKDDSLKEKNSEIAALKQRLAQLESIS